MHKQGFGGQVALSSNGTIALLGAAGINSGKGAAYVFTEQNGTWIQHQELRACDAAANDHFGSSVALSSDGSIALIGAVGKNTYTGAAYIFTELNNIWDEQKELRATDGKSDDGFGSSVALSGNGQIAVVGAPRVSNYPGAAYIFTEHNNGWTQHQELHASDAAPGDQFGVSVSLNGDGTIALIGAPSQNSYTGSAYIFTQQ